LNDLFVLVAEIFHQRDITSMPLTPWSFDQEFIGWRSFDDILIQIDLIESYLRDHSISPMRWNPYVYSFKQKIHPYLLYFHLGQCYVEVNDLQKGKDALNQSFKDFELDDLNTALWNNYVEAWVYYTEGSFYGIECCYEYSIPYKEYPIANNDWILKLKVALEKNVNPFCLTD
jgi:hypothetical protein